MFISSRAKEISESVTLKLNARATELADEGEKIYNLTAGQLPFKPDQRLVEQIANETNFLKSFQYSPVPGFPSLRKKVIKFIEESREISFDGHDIDAIISNGGKHSLSIALSAIVDPGDEVIIIAPYWVSYPEMIKLYGGVPVVVNSSIFDNFEPSIDDIKKVISEKTRAIIINSPQNPSGTHYRPEWMEKFADMMTHYPELTILTDEIYYTLNYYDPKPTYFYQFKPELLKQTLIFDGISKSFACTGLRIGFTIGPSKVIKAMGRLQGQTSSGANSLIQRALDNFDFNHVDEYLKPIKEHLRTNATILRDAFREANMSNVWYQTASAFYFLLDFDQCPIMNKYRKGPEDNEDYAAPICEEILNELGVAIVPSSDFGVKNAARISLVNEPGPFKEAITLLLKYIAG